MSGPFLVAVTTDVKEIDNYRWHAAIWFYLDALTSVGLTPILVPCLKDRIDHVGLLKRVDGVLVTGSRSNVRPELYGETTTERDGPYDDDRDATTFPLIRNAIDLGKPLLCICRGIQELNVALGGTLLREIQEDEGRMDHRGPSGESLDARFEIRHQKTIAPDSRLHTILGDGTITANSVHRQALGKVADSLQIVATAEDGTIEAVEHKTAKGFVLGVQWHPEYWVEEDIPSRRIFEAFAEAVKQGH